MVMATNRSAIRGVRMRSFSLVLFFMPDTICNEVTKKRITPKGCCSVHGLAQPGRLQISQESDDIFFQLNDIDQGLGEVVQGF